MTLSKKTCLFILCFVTTLMVTGCSTPHHASYGPTSSGMASWYGREFHGRRTASGDRFDMHALTAAHRKLPFGTKVEVTNLKTGRKVVVRINDRGPWTRGRIIDLSYAAAQRIGLARAGSGKVLLRVVQ